MAGKHGGGSWKVAYADFVTAMMAFFLVMWIGAQDVKVRQSVANYFVDPDGVSKKPVKEGAVMDSPTSGPVTDESKVTGGRGLRAPGGKQPNPSTRAVAEWIRSDPKRFQHWKAQAQRCREAANGQNAVNQTKPPEEVAAEQLSQLIRAEITAGIPNTTPEVYKEMLFGSFKEVDWTQLADDLLAG